MEPAINGQAGKELRTPHMLRQFLLICGIMATLLYISTDILLAMHYEGYSYRDQAISELSAIGAPTQPQWVAMTFIFNPLLIAFGIGVWKSAGNRRPVRLTGILLSMWGLFGFMWLFFPMHMRGEIGSATDTGHLVMSGLTVLLITMFIWFGSTANGRWFRRYSWATLAIMLVLGAWVGQQAPRVAA